MPDMVVKITITAQDLAFMRTEAAEQGVTLTDAQLRRVAQWGLQRMVHTTFGNAAISTDYTGEEVQQVIKGTAKRQPAQTGKKQTLDDALSSLKKLSADLGQMTDTLAEIAGVAPLPGICCLDVNGRERTQCKILVPHPIKREYMRYPFSLNGGDIAPAYTLFEEAMGNFGQDNRIGDFDDIDLCPVALLDIHLPLNFFSHADSGKYYRRESWQPTANNVVAALKIAFPYVTEWVDDTTLLDEVLRTNSTNPKAFPHE